MTATRHPWNVREHQRIVHGPRRRPWRRSVKTVAGASTGLRVLVFLLGLVFVVAGGALWLLSAVLTLPLMFAGLWVWSWEFVWARRLMDVFERWARPFVRRLRTHPVRWCTLTTLTLVATGAGYWAFMQYAPW